MKVFNDLYEAWEFLKTHPLIEYAGGYPAVFRSCFFVEPIKLDPVTKEEIAFVDADKAENFVVGVNVEFGPWIKPEKIPDTKGAFDPYGDIATHTHLDCSAPTFEEAVMKLAELMLKEYGGRCLECGEWRKDDDRVKGGMKCGLCAYGWPGSNATYI